MLSRALWSFDEMEENEDEKKGYNSVKAWLGIIGVCAVFSVIGYFGYLLFAR
jgi:hypothetical protein